MKKIISFFGGDSNVGTTMIAQSVAEELANKHNQRVLFIMASCKLGIDYIPDGSEASLDDIRVNITNRTIVENDVLGIIGSVNKLDYIPPIKGIETAIYYGIDDIGQLIEPIAKRYDYFVIDGGCDLNLGLNISALKYATEIYYVVTQSPKCIRRFNVLKKSILEPLGFEGSIIVNKHINNPVIYSFTQIKEILGAERNYKVQFVKDGIIAESESQTLVKLRHAAFESDIDLITGDILGKKQTKLGKGHGKRANR